MQPKVSVIVPIRNEEKYIAACLRSLLTQTYPTTLFEILVVDGRSSDRSRDIVRTIEAGAPNVRCLDNPGATAPAGMNAGIRNSVADIIIRADGHNFYPNDYIENCVKYLDKTGADNVGGPWRTIPASSSFSARLVAAVLSSPFGVGDASFRTTQNEGYVETVPFGAFRRELFDRVGMYNEKLVRNQDVDLNARIRMAGGKIYQTPALQTEYHPVAGFWELLRLTFRTSQWHLYSLSENVKSLGPRHFAPALFVSTIAGLLLVAFFSRYALLAITALLLIHLLVGYCIVIPRGKSNGFLITCALPFACLCFHVSYGLGTLAGVRYLLKAPPTRPIRAGQPVSE